MTLFTTDSEATHFAVVILQTGRTIFTANTRDLAVRYLRANAPYFDELEVREVITTVTSRRSFRPSRRVANSGAGPACPPDRDLAIPAVPA